MPPAFGKLLEPLPGWWLVAPVFRRRGLFCLSNVLAIFVQRLPRNVSPWFVWETFALATFHNRQGLFYLSRFLATFVQRSRAMFRPDLSEKHLPLARHFSKGLFCLSRFLAVLLRTCNIFANIEFQHSTLAPPRLVKHLPLSCSNTTRAFLFVKSFGYFC